MQTVLIHQPIAILHPSGHLNASTATEFQHQLIQAISAQGTAALLVNMQQVEFLDSAGLMSLVSALRLARSLNRRFSLCSVSPTIRMVFELSQLDRVFEIFESEAAFASTWSAMQTDR